MDREPAYLRIAAELRARIVSGELAQGAKLPSESQLKAQYDVSTTSVKYALSLLRSEGLIEGRKGSGNYVRGTSRLTRRAHARDMRSAKGSTSPFARDVARAGMQAHWEHHSERVPASPRIAQRLGIEPGDLVMMTHYRYFADDTPIQLAESHEPLDITAGTPVEWPEDGAAVGVVARMDLIGVEIDRFIEEVAARPATPDEANALNLDPRGGLWVLTIERTYYAGGRAVETADIVFPGDRYRLIYEMPIDPAQQSQ